MSAVAQAGARAAAQLVDVIMDLAAEELPEVAAEPVDGGVRLTGPGLLNRRLTDVRLAGLAASAVRRAR